MTLASLFAQTLQSWECVVVDDGSSDGLQEWMSSVTDLRVHYHRLERNQGRGYAHQCALGLAKGRYFCTIDGDDWIYPTKLETQVAFLESHPELAAVSTGIARVDKHGVLRGIDSTSTRVFRAGQLEFRRFYFGTAMCRTEQARRIGFRSEFRRSQDYDFFTRLLLKRPYAVLEEVLYVYDFAQAATLDVVLEGLESNQRTLLSVFWLSPFLVSRKLSLCLLKRLVYPWLARLGVWTALTQRSRGPTPAQINCFLVARRTVLIGDFQA